MLSNTIEGVPVADSPHIRAYRLLILTLLLRPAGNLILTMGMHHIPDKLGVAPWAYVQALFQPLVALGIMLLILSLLTRMALLSLADLSYVLPLTATGYIFSTLLGKYFLAEDVRLNQWLGTLLIFLGVSLVSPTAVRSPGTKTS